MSLCLYVTVLFRSSISRFNLCGSISRFNRPPRLKGPQIQRASIQAALNLRSQLSATNDPLRWIIPDSGESGKQKKAAWSETYY